MKKLFSTKRLLIALTFVLLSFLLLPAHSVTANADMGPKDNLTVYVVNPPDEEYYLDLLAQNLPADGGDSYLNEEERKSLDEDMLAMLFSLKDEGWLPAVAHGTYMPMWGKLTGEKSGEKMKHSFGYYGLPDTYRIIIVTKSGKISVSEPCTRKVLQGSVTYDYKTGQLSTPSLFSAYLAQFLITFSLTILIEGIILLIFRYKLKKNWLIFLLVNLATQIIMTLTVGITLIKAGSLSAYFILIPVEFGILIAEPIAYMFLLKGKSKKRNVVYGIIANLASFVAGFLIMGAMFALITKIL